MFDQNSICNSHNVRRDPVYGLSKARKPAMNNHEFTLGYDHARRIFEGCRSALDKVEETFAARLDVGAVLDVVR